MGPMGIEEVITLDMGLMDVWRSHVSKDKYFVSFPLTTIYLNSLANLKMLQLARVYLHDGLTGTILALILTG